MIKWLFGVGCLALCAVTSAKAALATYTFTSAETEVPTVANLTFGQFTRVNVSSDPLAGAFRSGAWNTGTSIDTAEYVQFTIQAAANFQFTFTDLAVDITSRKSNGVGNNGGPVHLDIRIFSLDGVTELAALGDTTLVADSRPHTLTWDFADLTSASGFTVRLYGWQAEDANGSVSLDNFVVNGSVNPVPEPVNLALGLFAAAAVGVTAGRRALKARTC